MMNSWQQEKSRLLHPLIWCVWHINKNRFEDAQFKAHIVTASFIVAV